MATNKAKLIEQWKDEIRNLGRVPYEDHDESNATVSTLEALCKHGYGLWIWKLERDGDSDLYKLANAEEYQDTCATCVIDKKDIVCPNCDERWPTLPEQDLVAAWREDRDLVFDSKCPKCGTPWVIWKGEGPAPDPASEEDSDGWELAYAPIPKLSKVGRNDPCPCGSGKKHKKCCLGKS